jgi:hypothetical protein
MYQNLSSTHRAIVVVDVEKFGDPGRTNTLQLVVREGLYRIVEQAFREAGIDWRSCRHEDRGDGILILVAPDVSKSLLVDQLPDRLVAALRQHNARSSVPAQIRLRVALDAGEIYHDDFGVTGEALVRAFRLLNAPVLKEALGSSSGSLALITSDWFYRDVVRHVPAAAPDAYLPARATVKETDVLAWVRLPDNVFPTTWIQTSGPGPGTTRVARWRRRASS